MVRKYMEREIPREYAYIITGTHGTKLTMNEDNDEKKPVRMPASYWKAFCHQDGNRVYSWVYSQINENDQTQSQGYAITDCQSVSLEHLYLQKFPKLKSQT